MNKPVYSGLLILEISKMVMFQFQYEHVKSKYGEIPKLCYKDTYSFIVYIKTEDINSNFAEDVSTRNVTSTILSIRQTITLKKK